MSTQSENLNQVQNDVAVMKNDISYIKATQARMEGKMDGFAFVKQSDYDVDKLTFMTKAEFKPYKWFFYTVGGVIIAGVGGAFITWIIRGGLK